MQRPAIARRARPLRDVSRPRSLRSAQPRGGADQQNAGHPAADRGLGQRHIDREQTYPDERQQQSIDDIADRGRERSGREYGPGRDRENQECEADVERLQNAHAAVPLRRTARPMSCAAVAPANCTSAQMATSLSAASGLSRARQEAEHDEAKTEIVSLGQRVQAAQRVRKAQQSRRAGEEEKDAGADRDDAEEVEDETSSAIRGVRILRGRALLTKAAEAKAASSASPSATSSTPRAPVAAAMRRSEPIPPVPMSCAAIMRSASPGPLKMRTRPTATVKRITPAVARRKSVKANRPDEQKLFRRQIGRDRLADVEAVNEKRALFVGSGRQRSRHQTRQGAECGSLAPGGQPQRAGDKSGPQRQRRIERPPGDIRSRNHRLAQETQVRAPRARRA